MNKNHKLPRLFLNTPIEIGQEILISNSHSHYISNVLRLKPQSFLRIFNEDNGEFLAQILSASKKNTTLKVKEYLRQPQKEIGPTIAFSLIKKQRQDFLIEKCTELGVHSFQPIITDHCEVRKVSIEKLKLQVIEAAEQCERLTLPKIQEPQKLSSFLGNPTKNLYYCIERENTPFIREALKKTTAEDIFLIGPEGGFSDKEKELLKDNIDAIAVNLGPTILRAETAAITCAVAWQLGNRKP
jgi:16S rRNA (uracil1498-N3)-methyltransferase